MDRVHDHVLRVLGDRELAARVTTDTVVRGIHRAADGTADALTLPSLLRAAHTQTAALATSRRVPDAALTAELARARRDPDAAPTGNAVTVVTAIAGLDLTSATLIDLTCRAGLESTAAGRALGLGRSAATDERDRAFAALDAAVGGPSTRAVWTTTLASLAVQPAPAHVHERIAAALPATGVAGLPAVPPVIAWVAAAAISLGVASALPGAVQRWSAATAPPVDVAVAVAIDGTPGLAPTDGLAEAAPDSGLTIGVPTPVVAEVSDAEDADVATQDGTVTEEPAVDAAPAPQDEPSTDPADESDDEQPEDRPSTTPLAELLPMPPMAA